MQINLSYIKVTFSVIVWGASFVATKIALRDISPITIVWLRFAIGVVILGIAVFHKNIFALPCKRDFGYFLLIGFLGITFHQWLQSTGLVTSQASTTAWIVATTPVFMAFLGWMFLGETITPVQLVGIGLAALGVILVVSNGDLNALSLRSFGKPGDILILISAPNWAVFSILSRHGLSKHPATRMMLFVMFSGWMMTTLFFFSSPGKLFTNTENLFEIVELSLSGWIGIAFLGVACTGLAYIFWYDGLQTIPASQLGSFLYIEPLVTVIISALILNEPIFLASIIGGGMILLGVWIVNKKREQ